VDAEKRKESWAIIQAVGSIYCCIIGTWTVLHPIGSQAEIQGSAPVNSHLVWWQVILVAGFAICAIVLAIGAFINFPPRRHKEIAQEKTVSDTSQRLIIHRAVYAAGLPTEVSVTDKLQKAARDALVIPIDSTLGNLLPRDPAFNVCKRLDVDYSYGSDTVFRISRMEPPPGEIGRLLLPEDSEIQRLTNEVTQLKQQLEVAAKALPNDPAGEVLRAIAKEDAVNILKMVLITYHKGFRFDPGSDPYVDLVVVLANYSVFEVAMVGKLEGRTMYSGDDLPTEPQVVDPPSLSVKHGNSTSLRIRQYISTTVADRMVAERSRKVPIDFRPVKITFEMRLDGMPARTFVVNGPVITIDEATRL
jgi:hypothetical protein